MFSRKQIKDLFKIIWLKAAQIFIELFFIKLWKRINGLPERVLQVILFSSFH